MSVSLAYTKTASLSEKQPVAFIRNTLESHLRLIGKVEEAVHELGSTHPLLRPPIRKSDVRPRAMCTYYNSQLIAHTESVQLQLHTSLVKPTLVVQLNPRPQHSIHSWKVNMDAPRKTSHRISKPGILTATVGFFLVAYSIRWSRKGEGLGMYGISGVMLTSTLGALCLQGGIGLCMAWFMATNAHQDGGLDLPHSEPSSSLRGVDCEKKDVGIQGM